MEPTANFNAKTFVKTILRDRRSGALATLMRGTGAPYSSLVNIATAADGSPLLLISSFAVHTKNILADSRVSLMLDERKEGNPLQGGRAMLMGRAVATDDRDVRRRYFERQPEDKLFIGFTDFAFYKMAIESAHYVVGFGRIGNLKQEDILTRVDDAAKLIAAEPDIVAHLNEDHAESCRLYATKLLGGTDGAWRCVGCDPEGLELQLGLSALRLPFPKRVRTPGALRKALIQLSRKARAA